MNEGARFLCGVRTPLFLCRGISHATALGLVLSNASTTETVEGAGEDPPSPFMFPRLRVYQGGPYSIEADDLRFLPQCAGESRVKENPGGRGFSKNHCRFAVREPVLFFYILDTQKSAQRADLNELKGCNIATLTRLRSDRVFSVFVRENNAEQ